MQSFKLIKYFLYLATNWNLRIAFHIIRQERIGEKKYGIRSTGADELRVLQEKGIDTSHATIYMPASYDMLEDIFEQIKDVNISHFIDIGCGKGRALCVAAHFGMKKVSGIDFSKEFCAEAEENLALTKQQIPQLRYSVKNNDAFYFEIPTDADCLFFFNPFDETIMSGVVENIQVSLEKKPRDLAVIYLNPLHKELFTQAGFTETYHTRKLNYLEGCIMNKLTS